MVLTPRAVVIDGRLESGLEVELDDAGQIVEVRGLFGDPGDYVLSPAFVNAHSHFEYRGLQGQLSARGYVEFIKEITSAKQAQSASQVREDCLVAAYENRQTGVAYVAEHSDRPFSGEALQREGLDGIIFQELITFAESTAPGDKLAQVAENMRQNAKHFDGEVHINPHTPWTVDENSLRSIAEAGGRISIHVAESVYENDYFQKDKGPIAQACHSVGVSRTLGLRVVPYLSGLGYLRHGVQFVHCCDVDGEEIAAIASSGVSVAHCPRSNEALDCPRMPLREMLDAGVLVGLGLDSAASSGPIDMFAEMRSALEVAARRGAEVTPEEVWRMATTMGAESLGIGGWEIGDGSFVPLIKVHVEDAESAGDVIATASPRSVEWVNPTVRN
jgi:cytosine/adenosine deaminase-related metal-dependent hydrolase